MTASPTEPWNVDIAVLQIRTEIGPSIAQLVFAHDQRVWSYSQIEENGYPLRMSHWLPAIHVIYDEKFVSENHKDNFIRGNVDAVLASQLLHVSIQAGLLPSSASCVIPQKWSLAQEMILAYSPDKLKNSLSFLNINAPAGKSPIHVVYHATLAMRRGM